MPEVEGKLPGGELWALVFHQLPPERQRHTKKPEGTYPPGSPPPIHFHGILRDSYPLRPFMQLYSRHHHSKHHSLPTEPISATLTGFFSPRLKIDFSTVTTRTPIAP